jgi:hypothetical protein
MHATSFGRIDHPQVLNHNFKTQNKMYITIQLAARPKEQVWGCSSAETVGSNPAGDVDVCLLLVLCIVKYLSLR